MQTCKEIAIGLRGRSGRSILTTPEFLQRMSNISQGSQSTVVRGVLRGDGKGSCVSDEFDALVGVCLNADVVLICLFDVPSLAVLVVWDRPQVLRLVLVYLKVEMK